MKAAHVFIACQLLSPLGAGTSTTARANSYMHPAKTTNDAKCINGQGSATAKAKPAMVVEMVMLQLTVFEDSNTSATKLSVTPAVAAEGEITAVLNGDGSLWITGDNYYGQLGGAISESYRSTFSQVLTGVQAVDLGYEFQLVLKADGSVWSAGWNGVGQLLDGAHTNRDTLTKVLDPSIHGAVQAIAAGKAHAFVLNADGSLWAGGFNQQGQLGLGFESTGAGGVGVSVAPAAQVQHTGAVQAMAGGYYHSVIVNADGSVWTAGGNQYGMLCDGTTVDKNTFTQVHTGGQAAAAGFGHTVILNGDGSVWTGGLNGFGQLGGNEWDPYRPNGDSRPDSEGGYSRHTLAQVHTGAQAVSSVREVTFVLNADGSVWSAGSDNSNRGSLVDGGSISRDTFQQVHTGAQGVSAGAFHAAVLNADGTVWTGGYNSDGQLGDGTRTTRNTLAQVHTLSVVPAPTPPPTPAPTAAPPAPAPAQSSPGSAVGDPHITNLVGVSFDVNQPGDYALVRLPFDFDEPAELEIRATMSPSVFSPCGLWIKEVSFRGKWVEGEIRVRTDRHSDTKTEHFAVLVNNSSVQPEWRPWDAFVKHTNVTLSDRVVVLPAFKEMQGAVATRWRRVFEFLIGSSKTAEERVSIVIVQGGKAGLDVKAKRLGKFGVSRVGGLMGTESHDPVIEEPSLQCTQRLKGMSADMREKAQWTNSADAGMLLNFPPRKDLTEQTAALMASW